MNAHEQHAPAPRLVRPYAVTGGRTHGGRSLPLEALVVSTRRGSDLADQLTFERARILRMCDAPSSLVEISAEVGVPVGVARVLVGDLAVEGLVEVHERQTTVDNDVQLLERVLDGINAL